MAVIVPAFGVAHLVGEALASLQAQTMREWECVVVDDGAPDGVAAAVAPFLVDPRITLLETDNGGVSVARNRAIAASSAPLIALLDGDDRLRPDYLARTCAALEADSQVRIVTVNARIYGAVPTERTCVTGRQGRGNGVHGSLADVLDRSFGVYIGSTFRRADFEAAGGFDPAMTHAEDFDLWVRLMLLGGSALYIDEILADYRVRGCSASASGVKMLKGNIRTYEKALSVLPKEAPEADVARAMIAENRRELRFALAADRIIDGDTSALADLRANAAPELGRTWQWAFLLWRLVPRLAPPMLALRQRRNARGAGAPDIETVPPHPVHSVMESA
ncbi:glycosyltransferase family A protein [Aurantiacibacter poecillastricola]|uniref:glycosyltransferase family A protein n=1 Tax=Aurantiacibacter poecillastricola TaxID=3064385 RepID=UPI00273EC85A|nr:glycosyltransferase family A protein [Aurantiacibacter sp. 219JJ12-13]MDP5263168.1 glycosyltransferase family A protein [Aurantiacibacter sp. 219JJ12-13]